MSRMPMIISALLLCLAAFATLTPSCLESGEKPPADKACHVVEEMCVESTDGWPDEHFEQHCEDEVSRGRRCLRAAVVATCERAMHDGVPIRIVFYKGYPNNPGLLCGEKGGKLVRQAPLSEEAAF